MPLPVGSKLGPYEILAPLGAGGMGEVYRARDTKLGRDVAIKVLPAEVSADKERRQRFEQEARAASSLNHPSVVHVYDIGTSDSTVYIAMELVEGRTLREVVTTSAPLPAKKILDLALPIADGLARAHEAGIVHRDLKPENVMVSKDGHVRILDFGLAKLVEPEAGPEAATSPQLTRSGLVVGTLGYMSPEQAAGKAVDFRSDQFALGTILYEIASGRQPFRRETGPETLTAILREQPEPLSRLAPGLPAPLRWIVEERCLAKDPDERYASTRDLLRELHGLREHLSEASASGLSRALPTSRRRLGLAAAVLGALAALAAGVLAGREIGARPSSGPPSFRRLTFRSGTILKAWFAPDGQTIVYSARFGGQPWEVFSTRVDSPESRSLGLPSASLLSVSSSGELAVQIGSRSHVGWERTGTLARVPLAGGAPREVLEDVEEADWAPDGRSLAIVRDVGGRRRLEFPIDRVLYETAGYISNPRVSPHGDQIAFLDHQWRGDNAGSVAVVDLAGRKKTLSSAFTSITGLQWAPSGKELWLSGAKAGGHNDLWVVSVAGEERLVWRESGAVALHHVSRDGRVLMSRNTVTREMTGLAPGAKEETSLSWLDWSFSHGLSEDGSLLLFDEEGEGAGESYAVYFRKTDGSPAVRLGQGRALGLSLDAAWALADTAQSLVLLPVGAGTPKTLPATGMTHHTAAWFPDGRRILLVANEPGKGSRLYVQDISGGEPRPITPEGVSFARGAGGGSPVSPDGTLVAARSPDRRVLLYPVQGGDPRPVPGIVPEEYVIRWTPDGRGLYAYRPTEMPTRVFIVDIETGRRVLWRALAPRDPSGVEVLSPILVSGDGRAYVYSHLRQLDELYLVEGLK